MPTEREGFGECPGGCGLAGCFSRASARQGHGREVASASSRLLACRDLNDILAAKNAACDSAVKERSRILGAMYGRGWGYKTSTLCWVNVYRGSDVKAKDCSEAHLRGHNGWRLFCPAA